jgi:hypothetical protein
MKIPEPTIVPIIMEQADARLKDFFNWTLSISFFISSPDISSMIEKKRGKIKRINNNIIICI